MFQDFLKVDVSCSLQTKHTGVDQSDITYVCRSYTYGLPCYSHRHNFLRYCRVEPFWPGSWNGSMHASNVFLMFSRYCASDRILDGFSSLWLVASSARLSSVISERSCSIPLQICMLKAHFLRVSGLIVTLIMPRGPLP